MLTHNFRGSTEHEWTIVTEQCRGLIWKSEGLEPFRQIVHEDNCVLVSIVRFWELNNINTDAVERA